MDSESRRKEVKVIGLYLIIILVILRFLVYPLHGAVERKKLILDEQSESYRLKYQLLEKKEKAQSGGPVVTRDAVLPYLYDSGISITQIQAEVIEEVAKLAENKGMTVLNFEMPEALAGKKVTEVPVQIRLSGKPEAFRDLLAAIGEAKKVLGIKSMEINTLSGQELSYMLVISAFRVEK
jgi:Tfp pilus assembly protein PilO